MKSQMSRLILIYSVCPLDFKALKAIFNLNKYLYSFTTLKLSHRLELFDKLVSPFLNYSLFGVTMDKHFPMVYQNLFF